MSGFGSLVWLKKTKRAFLDALFPIYCCGCEKEGVWACPSCTASLRVVPLNLCAGCGLKSIGGIRHKDCNNKTDLNVLISPYHYANPFIRRLIKEYKYHGAKEIEVVLQSFVGVGVRSLATLFPTNAIVVPMPLHASRERDRGFNQAERFAQTVASVLGVKVATPLTRIKKTSVQAKLAIVDRQENCRDAFSCTPISGDYILVDDVVTSGATLKEAAKAMKQAGARSVIGFALSHGSGDRLGD